jgi:hypothetical protein
MPHLFCTSLLVLFKTLTLECYIIFPITFIMVLIPAGDQAQTAGVQAYISGSSGVRYQQMKENFNIVPSVC